MQTLTRNGTDGRVYGGDCDLIHIADGKRTAAGMLTAAFVEEQMRVNAERSGARSPRDAETQLLCPGCYMIVLVNAAAELAARNRQPLRELGRTMAAAFTKLADAETVTAAFLEEIQIILDGDDVAVCSLLEDGE